jgi:hypothetical protein
MRGINSWHGLSLMCVLMVALLGGPASAEALSVNVHINTAAVQGQAGQLVFDFTANTPFHNDVDILNFATNGVLGLPQTQGGLVTGDLILGLNPAPHTTIESGSFFNELAIQFTSFGQTIDFGLMVGNNAPPAGAAPDEFALFLLNAGGNSLFPTADPLGADALLTFDATGGTTGTLSVFSPVTFTPPASINVTVPGAVVGVPESSTVALLGSGGVMLVWWRRRHERQ